MTAYDHVLTQLPKAPRTWLVTGVAGFIGSNLLAAKRVPSPFILDDDREGCLFVATVHRKSADEIAPIKPENAPVNASLSNLQMQLLKLVQADPGLSYDQLAALTAKDRTTIMRNMAKLKTTGTLQRVGSKKSGHWQVIK